MKIAYLDPTAQGGGAERILFEILAAVRAARPDWPLHVTFGAAGPMVLRIRALGVSTAVLPFPPSLARLGDAQLGPNGNRRGTGMARLLQKMLRAAPATAAYLVALRRTLAQFAPDLVHANGLKMDLLGLWARPRGTPVLWHVHDDVARRPMMARLMRLNSGACAGAVANSKSVAEWLRTVCGDRLRVFAVYNAVDLGRFSPLGRRLDLDALAGLHPAPAGTVRVGLVATMARWKGHEVFLRALSALPATLPIRGYIVGGPIYQTDDSQYSVEELRAIASTVGVSDRVGFTGFVDDSAAAMRTLDIVVHASTQPEPFGLVIAEAMACEKAVIVSEAGGAAEIVSVGTDVLSHRPGDAAALARAIVAFATDARLRSRFGRAARASAEQKFDRARLADELIPIYRGLSVN